jgi:hypothetical protein
MVMSISTGALKNYEQILNMPVMTVMDSRKKDSKIKIVESVRVITDVGCINSAQNLLTIFKINEIFFVTRDGELSSCNGLF